MRKGRFVGSRGLLETQVVTAPYDTFQYPVVSPNRITRVTRCEDFYSTYLEKRESYVATFSGAFPGLPLSVTSRIVHRKLAKIKAKTRD